MKARKIIAEANCCEDARQAIGLAFDEGWRIVGPYFSDDASEVEAVRLKLAQTLLSKSSNTTRDPDELIAIALASLGWLPRGHRLTRDVAATLRKVA